MTRITRLWTYTVIGLGPFPVDMLRYDAAWPATERDSAALAQSLDHRAAGLRHVRLHGLTQPTGPRWSSFGWEVQDPDHGRRT